MDKTLHMELILNGNVKILLYEGQRSYTLGFEILYSIIYALFLITT